jgi:hypothetical protein
MCLLKFRIVKYVVGCQINSTLYLKNYLYISSFINRISSLNRSPK